MIQEGIPKIADFGAGKEINKTTSHKDGIMGAVCYFEPLRFSDDKYELKISSDIYSLGVILWQISSGKPPFENEERNLALFEKIAEGQRESSIEGTPKRFIQLYETCWNFDPQMRITIAEVLRRLEAMKSDDAEKGIYLILIYAVYIKL